MHAINNNYASVDLNLAKCCNELRFRPSCKRTKLVRNGNQAPHFQSLVAPLDNSVHFCRAETML